MSRYVCKLYKILEEESSRDEGDSPPPHKPETQSTGPPSETSLALMNPLILDSIFSKLDTRTLKIARQICQTWADIGATHLATRTYFMTCHMLPHHCSRILPPFNPKLAKIVKVIFCNCRNPENNLLKEIRHEIMTKNFFTLFTQIHEVTEVLDFSINSNFSLAPLIRSLSILKFPHLKELTLHEPHVPEEAISQNQLCMLPKRPSLTRLNVHLAREKSPFGQILQKLVNAAPNLGILQISGNQTPCLAECKMLKCLEFKGTYKHTGQVMFSMQKLNGMLADVKNSLVELVLKMDDLEGKVSTAGNYNVDENFTLPTMPLLIILTVLEVDLFSIQNDWSPKKVPVLKELYLRSKKRLGVSSCVSALHIPHDRLESLELWGDGTVDSVKRIRQIFPTLKNLEVVMICPDLTDENKMRHFTRRIEAFGKLNRDHLTITVSRIHRFIYAMIALDAISRLKASVVVNLEFTRSAYIDSYNKPGFEVMLQSCKQISKITFEGEGIIPLIGKNLVTKSGNLLPVTIISRPVISMDIRLLLDEDLQNM